MTLGRIDVSQIDTRELDAEHERDVYHAMVADLLASAHPHPVEHPTMMKQWTRARELLKNGPPPREDGAVGCDFSETPDRGAHL